jgi:hypothetical protein
MKSRAQLPPGGMSGRNETIDSSIGSTAAAVVSVEGAMVVSLDGAPVVGGAVVVPVAPVVVVVVSSPQPKTSKVIVSARDQAESQQCQFLHERTPHYVHSLESTAGADRSTARSCPVSPLETSFPGLCSTLRPARSHGGASVLPCPARRRSRDESGDDRPGPIVPPTSVHY